MYKDRPNIIQYWCNNAALALYIPILIFFFRKYKFVFVFFYHFFQYQNIPGCYNSLSWKARTFFPFHIVNSMAFHIVSTCLWQELGHQRYREFCEENTSKNINGLVQDCDIFIAFEIEISQSYTLGREYWVMRNRYSRLLFTSEDRLCANLRVQEQSTSMTSQC